LGSVFDAGEDCGDRQNDINDKMEADDQPPNRDDPRQDTSVGQARHERDCADGDPRPPRRFPRRTIVGQDGRRLADGATRIACLTLQGRLLVFGIDELKLQSNGGRGLTLIDLDTKDPLVSVAAFGDVLQVLGTGRGGAKEKDETLKGAALAAYEGKRARKGKKQDLMVKAMRVLPAVKG